MSANINTNMQEKQLHILHCIDCKKLNNFPSYSKNDSIRIGETRKVYGRYFADYFKSSTFEDFFKSLTL